MKHRRHTPLQLASLAVALLVVFAGVAPGANAAQRHASPVQITIWTAYTKALLPPFTHLITEFERQHPSIAVTEVSSENYNALLQKEQSAVFAGNPPTVAQAYESWVQQFTQNHAVQSLNPYINGTAGLSAAEIKDYFAADWKDSLLNGSHYMMPFSKSDIVLYYNPAILKKYGITSPPKTWYEFATDCAKVTKITNGRPSQWGSTVQVSEAEWYAWEYEWGGTVLNANGKAAFATAKGIAPVSFFANLAKKKVIVVSTNQNYQDEADFDAGKAAFDFNTSAELPFILAGAQPGVQVAVAPFPAGPVQQTTELYGAPLVMFAKASSAQKQAAWTLLKWLTAPQQTAYWSMNTGYMPVRRSALDLPVMRAYYQKNPTRKAAVEQLDHAVIEPALNGWPKAQNDIQTNLLAALTGSREPAAAMRQAAQQVDGDLSQH